MAAALTMPAVNTGMGSGAELSPRRAPDTPVVLLIEDDFWTRCTAAVYLRAVGYRVIEAENAAESIDVLSSGTHVDFVFSDINLSGSLNGLAFAQWLAQHHPTVPILLTSGAHQEATAMATVCLFVVKPYKLDEVERLIRAML
jgi:DNA-binding NtrC family response regulator